METTTRKMTIAKIEDREVDELRIFLQFVGEKVKFLERLEDDCNDWNEEIGKFVRQTFPHRPAFIALINLEILLDIYQDKESTIIKHPKWIVEMVDLLNELNEYLSSNPKNYIGSGSILHQKISKYVSVDDVASQK